VRAAECLGNLELIHIKDGIYFLGKNLDDSSEAGRGICDNVIVLNNYTAISISDVFKRFQEAKIITTTVHGLRKIAVCEMGNKLVEVFPTKWTVSVSVSGQKYIVAGNKS
jgi:hypothetical protein